MSNTTSVQPPHRVNHKRHAPRSEENDSWTLLDEFDEAADTTSLSAGWCQVSDTPKLDSNTQDTMEYWKSRALQTEHVLQEKMRQMEKMLRQRSYLQTRLLVHEDPLNPFNNDICVEAANNQLDLDMYREVASTMKAIYNRAEKFATELEGMRGGVHKRDVGVNDDDLGHMVKRADMEQVDLKVLKNVSAAALGAVIRVNALSRRQLQGKTL